MARNINQIFSDNPITSVAGTSLIYLGVGGADGAIQGLNLYKSSTSDAIFNTGTFIAVTNQLVLGTTNTTTISSTAPSASRVYTIPDAGGAANFLMSAGTQTIAGANTFSSALTINPVSNQLVLGGVSAGKTTTISATAPAANSVYTIPDSGTSANFIMSAGTQTVGGSKTFSSTLTINPVSNQLVLGTTNTTTISSTAPSSSRTYTIPDAGGAANFLMSAGTQTIAGLNTFSSATTFSSTSNQLIFGGTHTATINVSTPASINTLYTVPDVGTCNFVMTAGDQSIAGNKSFTTQMTLSNNSNQVTFGNTSNIITLNVNTPSASRTYTMVDAGASANFLMSQGTQTIAGSNTFSSALTINPVSNQLILGGVSAGNTTTISATAPASNAIYTIPDVGTSANFVMSAGTQTVGGALTLSGTVVFSNAAPIKMNGGGSTFITLAINGPVTDRVYTFPDVSADANVLLSRVVTSTIATTGATNPTAANSGTIIGIPVLTGNATATLPAVASSAGLRFRYVCTNGVTALGHTFVISTTDSKVLSGNFMVVSTNTQALFGTTNTLTFSASSAGSGDWLEFYCLNGKWNVIGAGFGAASISAA